MIAKANRKITPAQVQAVANKYLSRQNSTIGVLEPLPTNKDMPNTMPVMQGVSNVQ